MGMISKDELNKWIDLQVKKKNWLLLNDPATVDGRQFIYVTLTGQFVVVQYDINGNVKQVGQPMLMPTMQQGQGFPGGGFPPIAGKG